MFSEISKISQEIVSIEEKLINDFKNPASDFKIKKNSVTKMLFLDTTIHDSGKKQLLLTDFLNHAIKTEDLQLIQFLIQQCGNFLISSEQRRALEKIFLPLAIDHLHERLQNFIGKTLFFSGIYLVTHYSGSGFCCNSLITEQFCCCITTIPLKTICFHPEFSALMAKSNLRLEVKSEQEMTIIYTADKATATKPSSVQTQTNAETISSAVQSQANAETISSVVQSQANAETISSVVQSQANAETISSAVPSQANAKTIPSAVHTQSNAETLQENEPSFCVIEDVNVITSQIKDAIDTDQVSYDFAMTTTEIEYERYNYFYKLCNNLPKQEEDASKNVFIFDQNFAESLKMVTK